MKRTTQSTDRSQDCLAWCWHLYQSGAQRRRRPNPRLPRAAQSAQQALADGRGPAHGAPIAIGHSHGLGLERQEGEAGVHGTHDTGGVATDSRCSTRKGSSARATDGKLMFNPPVKQQRDKKGHPLTSTHKASP